ncbi:MAG: ABC transporter substrate-binding protein [Gordonia sp. (in: high G+C Gram-positive bacteria)]
MPADVVWFTRCPVPTAFGIAAATGRLRDVLDDAGVELRSLATAATEQRTAHFTQTQPHSVRHGGNIPPLVAASRGTELVIIGLSVAPSNAGLLTLPASGINGPADLRGRVIGVPRRIHDTIDFWRASALQTIDRALRAAGLGRADVTLRDIDIDRSFTSDSTRRGGTLANLWDATFMIGFQREETAALLRGDVEVIFSEGANLTITQSLTGSQVIYSSAGTGALDPRRSSNLRPLTLSVSADLLADAPDIVDLILDESLRTARSAAQEVDNTIRVLAGEVGLPEELVTQSFSDTLTSHLDVDLSPERVSALAQQATDLSELGFLDHHLDVEAIIDRAPLDRVTHGSTAAATSASPA